MTYMILGLIIFLATHSVRIFADGWRSRTITRIGADLPAHTKAVETAGHHDVEQHQIGLEAVEFFQAGV